MQTLREHLTETKQNKTKQCVVYCASAGRSQRTMSAQIERYWEIKRRGRRKDGESEKSEDKIKLKTGAYRNVNCEIHRESCIRFVIIVLLYCSTCNKFVSLEEEERQCLFVCCQIHPVFFSNGNADLVGALFPSFSSCYRSFSSLRCESVLLDASLVDIVCIIPFIFQNGTRE